MAYSEHGPIGSYRFPVPPSQEVLDHARRVMEKLLDPPLGTQFVGITLTTEEGSATIEHGVIFPGEVNECHRDKIFTLKNITEINKIINNQGERVDSNPYLPTRVIDTPPLESDPNQTSFLAKKEYYEDTKGSKPYFTLYLVKRYLDDFRYLHIFEIYIDNGKKTVLIDVDCAKDPSGNVLMTDHVARYQPADKKYKFSLAGTHVILESPINKLPPEAWYYLNLSTTEALKAFSRI